MIHLTEEENIWIAERIGAGFRYVIKCDDECTTSITQNTKFEGGECPNCGGSASAAGNTLHIEETLDRGAANREKIIDYLWLYHGICIRPSRKLRGAWFAISTQVSEKSPPAGWIDAVLLGCKMAYEDRSRLPFPT